VGFLAGLTTLILLFAGGRRVVLGYISPGELVALFSYFQMLIWPLMGAGFMVNMIQRGAAGMARINEVLQTVPGIRSPEQTEGPRSNASLEIEIRNLSFCYDKRPVLENINLVIPPGTVLGILGRTGSGKSTLLKTLVRMVDPPAESVFVGGIDVRRWDLAGLRRFFGVSPQDSYLFSDTIKNNIAYGIKETSDPDLEGLAEAALLSALDHDLENFSLGWETLIGERGLTLSGGQKQRVAIARAILSKPEILVLDDAFSAVDAETERRILSGILETRTQKRLTTIIVSHKVSTLSAADKVVVLDEGTISEYGTPAELLKSGKFFAKMAELQQLGEAAAHLGSDRV
jgi:ATP-binding cassette subfamily B protein